jgi:hypothetical protein
MSYFTLRKSMAVAGPVEATNKKVNKLTNLHGTYKDVILTKRSNFPPFSEKNLLIFRCNHNTKNHAPDYFHIKKSWI